MSNKANHILYSIYNKYSVVVFVFLIQSVIAFGQENANIHTGIKSYLNGNNNHMDADTPFKTIQINYLEIPKTYSTDAIIKHYAYSLLYNEAHEQATWVAYELTKEETVKKVNRKDKFITDPLVLTRSADGNDYAGTIYDRGHLAPAADMLWSDTAMKESFYYSNMSPQDRGFNRGIWKSLEESVRDWAIDNEAVYIVTGPVLTGELITIGPNKVSVPNYYYKVILDYKHPEIKGIGFIIPNKAIRESLSRYAVTIDSVEKFTGIDFFPLLPDDQENIIESAVCFNCWYSSLRHAKNPVGKPSAKSPVQCRAYTKAGKRCKNKTSYTNGKCFKHGGKH